jgi:topoisomerase-4 subunit A
LARLEGFKIEKELKERLDEQESLQKLLDDPKALKRLMIREIEADVKTYGDDRRTLIEAAERAVLETKVVDEPVTVIVSRKGWLRSRQGHGHDASQFSFKTGDSLRDALECRSTTDLVAIGTDGRVYTVPVSSLPSARGDGQPITSMIEVSPSAPIEHILGAPLDQNYLLAACDGYGFVASQGDMNTRQKAGKQFVTVEEGKKLLKPLALRPDDQYVGLLSEQGRFLVVDIKELKVLSKGGRGTVLIKLNEGDTLSQWVAFGEAGLAVSGVNRKRPSTIVMDLDMLANYLGKRAGKGKALSLKLNDPVLHRPEES